jgi:hypothetical protein
MATCSTTALEFADLTVHSVYCHWDGYISHVGSVLHAHGSISVPATTVSSMTTVCDVTAHGGCVPLSKLSSSH